MDFYFINEERIFEPDTGQRKSFGISYVYNGQSIIIPDIFTNKKDAEEVVEKFNRLDVSVVHIMDILEDLL